MEFLRNIDRHAPSHNPKKACLQTAVCEYFP